MCRLVFLKKGRIGGSKSSKRSPVPGSSAEMIGEDVSMLCLILEATSFMTRSRSLGVRFCFDTTIPMRAFSIHIDPSGLAMTSIVLASFNASGMTGQKVDCSMDVRRWDVLV